MKLFIQLFILLLSLSILYPANATEADKAPTITLNISNLPLPDVLVIIEKQSEMSFSYESSVIKDIPKVTLQVNQVPLRTCLDMLFRDLSVTYTIRRKIYYLTKKKQSRYDQRLYPRSIYNRIPYRCFRLQSQNPGRDSNQ
ncbi:hypothetical protein HMPREF1076_04654 [Parabacteroides goldsteinii CL02T12C30]|uniref:Secretin/TonB short N-terminal domain-containing protein n=1 Tax=Parabacteroides goldsteinii CL02T12C30 TaxID=999418 RepID=K5ZBH4_9BACT|nr:hypothetical protein HMPREF1076_04654 [Parabacteroides goldsteinii CL02T12C30]